MIKELSLIILSMIAFVFLAIIAVIDSYLSGDRA